MSGIPEVTVVIPTRNRWSLLTTRAVPSALAQEDVLLEVIVVDDGSTDETPARLAEHDDPRLRMIRHECPRGASAARNTGIAAAHGEWLAFLDDDDLWSPRKLRVQLDVGLADGADWVYAAAVIYDEAGVAVEAPPLAAPDTVARALMSGNVIWGGASNVVARADLIRRVGGFDETLVYVEDWDLWIKLARSGRAAVCDDVLVATLEHSGRTLFRLRADVKKQVESMLSKHGTTNRKDGLGVMEWLAEEHFRAGHRLRAAGLYLRAAITYGSLGNIPPALGALFGHRGMRLASSLLMATRGGSHLHPMREPLPFQPSWLELYR